MGVKLGRSHWRRNVGWACLRKGCCGKKFGPKGDEITREWRKLHNGEFNDLYSSPNIVRVIKWRRMWREQHVTRMGERAEVYTEFGGGGTPEGKIPLGRPRRRRDDNIKMNLQEVGCEGMDWSDVAQDRGRWRALVNAVMNLRVVWNAGNFLTSGEPIGFSRRTLFHGVSN